MDIRIFFSILAFIAALVVGSAFGASPQSQRSRYIKSIQKARSISSSENAVEPLVDDKQVPENPAPAPESGYGGGGETPEPEGGGEKKKILVFRLANRLAVAVCDTYDNYMRTGMPHKGQISYNSTVQDVRSPVPPGTCQSFKIRRCVEGQENCGWSKVPTC